jgi:Domain of unknown function (DUF4328)
MNADLNLILSILLALFVFSIGLLIAYILFLVTLHKTLALCGKRNRTMEPGMVWLILVPLFNFYWWFHMVVQIGRSLKNEFSDRDKNDGSDYGQTLGIWWGVAYVGGTVVGMGVQYVGMFRQAVQGIVQQNPFALDSPTVHAYIAQAPFLLASLVMWIVYWIKIARYKRQLELDGPRDDDRDDDRWRYEDDDDRDFDRPHRQSKPDERIR